MAMARPGNLFGTIRAANGARPSPHAVGTKVACGRTRAALWAPPGHRAVHIERLLEDVAKSGELAVQRGELERAVGSRPADASEYDAAMRDEDLALGTMAASSLGGARSPDLALQCFTRVWDSGAGARHQEPVEGESGDVSLAWKLALLHVEEDEAGDEEAKVEALLEGREDDAPPGGASRKHGGEEVTEEMAKAVIKDIRSLQVPVRPHSTLEATQRQIDCFFSQLPYKCHQDRLASVGD